MPRITKRLVDAAEPNGRDYFIWCDELPGFGVRVFASGRRSYLVQYRAGGRSRRVALGLHGALTADEARREARSVLGQVARGEDPAEERATRRKSITVPVATTNKMPRGKFLVGPFRTQAQIFDRMGVEVLASSEDSDNFRRNLITIRGEERLAFTVRRPSSFVYGDLSTSLAA